jgi:hypothetical protein
VSDESKARALVAKPCPVTKPFDVRFIRHCLEAFRDTSSGFAVWRGCGRTLPASFFCAGKGSSELIAQFARRFQMAMS